MAAGAAAVADATVRPVRQEDVPALVRLYAEVFRRPVTEAWYRWKILESPRPPGVPAAWIATNGERVIAHYGATGLSFRVRDETLPALHGCDLMTTPEQRGHGVFSALARAAHEGWAAHGVAFIIGLPTASWGRLRDRLGCRTALPLRWLWKPLRATAWLPRRWLRAIPRSPTGPTAPTPAHRHGATTVVPLDGAGRDVDALWRSVAPCYDALVTRDRRWIEYRYARRSGIQYRVLLARRGGEPVGYLAWRLVESGARVSGIIADVFTAPADVEAQHALLECAGRAARQEGATDLRTFAAPGTSLYAGLRTAGFYRRAGGFDSVVIPLARAVPRPLLDDAARWFIAGADFDVV